jgi:four helix bundle protein
MSDYRHLEVWRLAHATRLGVYRATEAYPPEEKFGLVTQTRRAAASISANIAEGAGRSTRPEYSRFLSYAMGSTNETEDHLLLAKDLNYLAAAEWETLAANLVRIRSMLVGLRRYLGSPRGRSNPETGNR